MSIERMREVVYTATGASTTEEDAVAIVEMLERGGVQMPKGIRSVIVQALRTGFEHDDQFLLLPELRQLLAWYDKAMTRVVPQNSLIESIGEGEDDDEGSVAIVTTLRRGDVSVPAVTVINADSVEVLLGDIQHTPLGSTVVTLVDPDERFATRTEPHVQARTRDEWSGSASNVNIATLCIVPPSISKE